MTERPASRRSRSHPLLRPFPLVVLTLATFLVVFAFMMGSLRGGTAAPAPAGRPGKVALVNGKRLVVRTTPSGRIVAAGAPAAAEGAGTKPAAAIPIVTSSSGAGASDD